MIFYFTGTGNSFAAAARLATAFDDVLEDIGKAAKHRQFDFELQEGEHLGFVFPTYAWNMPKIVEEFLSRANLRNEHGDPFRPDYCYAVITCGAFVGNTARYFEAELEEKLSFPLDASFSVKTVGNCIYLYEPANGEKQKHLLAEADKQTDSVIKGIARGARGHFETRNPLGIIGSRLMKKRIGELPTEDFFAHDTCTNCGFCVDICPTNTISVVNRRPRWEKHGCTQCLACVQRCPAHAIQYGHSTETRKRYVNPALLTR